MSLDERLSKMGDVEFLEYIASTFPGSALTRRMMKVADRLKLLESNEKFSFKGQPSKPEAYPGVDEECV